MVGAGSVEVAKGWSPASYHKVAASRPGVFCFIWYERLVLRVWDIESVQGRAYRRRLRLRLRQRVSVRL